MTGSLAIGIDLGGTQVRAGLVEGGNVLRRAAALTDVHGGPPAVLAQVRRLMSEVCKPEDWSRLAGVGVSAPGPLDSETGTILHIPTLPNWEGFALREILAADVGLPVIVENDGIAAAYGEWQFGVGRGLQHLVFVTVSTGVGGGVVVDGRLMHGRQGMAAHVGHFRMAPDGPTCSCGATGCFEAFAAGTALGRRAREAMRADPAGFLARLPTEESVDAASVVDGARQGDPLCLELLRMEANYLGAGFTALIHLYSPELVIMGGGVSQAFDLLEGDIRAVIRRDAMQPFKTVPVVRAGLRENSGLVGAAALVLDATRQSTRAQ
jgi:glucokinase